MKVHSFPTTRLICLFYLTIIYPGCFERDHGTGNGADVNQENDLVLAEVVADNAEPGRLDRWFAGPLLFLLDDRFARIIVLRQLKISLPV